MTLSEENGVRLRATISEFGLVLFFKNVNLNDTETGVVSLIFKYCNDKRGCLFDLEDIKKVINYIWEERKDEIEEHYGKIFTSTTGTILRKTIE